MFEPWLVCLSPRNTFPRPEDNKTQSLKIFIPLTNYAYMRRHVKIKDLYPVDEEGLCEFHHLQSDQKTDGDQVVVEDDKCQQVICKVGGDVP